MVHYHDGIWLQTEFVVPGQVPVMRMLQQTCPVRLPSSEHREACEDYGCRGQRAHQYAPGLPGADVRDLQLSFLLLGLLGGHSSRIVTHGCRPYLGVRPGT